MRRASRAAWWGLMGLLGLTVLVLLATNVFLRTSLLRKLVNGDPDTLVVDYRGAASWFPGHLSFDSLTLRSRDHNVEFEAVLQEVRIRVSLPDLLRRRFHTTRLRAQTLGFRLRERLSPEQATPARVARYPRIEGFADPPLLQTTPSLPEPAGNPWRIVIDGLSVASVEELWFDAWKWTGEALVEGSFELLPGLEARVGPARLDVATGSLTHGSSEVARRTFGAVWCQLPRFDTQAYPGNDVWKIMSGGSELRGDLVDAAFLSSDAGGPRLSGGAGMVRERIELKDGRGTVSVQITARGVTLHDGERRFRGSTKVDLRGTDVDFRRGEASLAGTQVVLSDVALGDAPSRPWAATFSAPAARLFFADGSFDAELVGTLRDARPVVALMSSGLAKWVAILLDLKDLHVTGRLAAGPSRLALTSLRLTAGDFSLEGDYRSSAGRQHGEFHATKGPLSVRFTIPGGS